MSVAGVASSVIGRGLVAGFLPVEEVKAVAREGLAEAGVRS